MPEEIASKPHIKISWFIWTLLAFGLFVLIAEYSSRMTWNYRDYDRQRVAERYDTLAKLRAEEHQTLTTADWVDQNKKIVRIPIDEAMTRELVTLKDTPAQIGSAIPTAAPAPAATNAPPATSAPPSTNAAPAAPTGATNAAPSTPPPAKPTN